LCFNYFKSEELIKFEVELKKIELEVGTGVYFWGATFSQVEVFYFSEKIVDKSVFPVQFQQNVLFWG